jgi:hypothetical protein
MRKSAREWVVCLWQALIFVALAVLWSAPAAAQDEAQAASGPPLRVALLLDSDTDRCYDRGHGAAIERLAALERDEINAAGGIHGRRLELLFFDNRYDDARTIENFRNALITPDLLAIVGLSSAERGKKVFDALGGEIRKSGAPFISHISVGEVFRDHPNVFSTRPSQEAERIPAIAAFISEMAFGDIAFVGRAGATYIDAIGDGLKKSRIADRLVADHRIATTGNGSGAKLDAAALDQAITDMKLRNAGLVVLAVGSSLSEAVIERLKAADFMPPVLLVGNLSRLSARTRNAYAGAFYQFDWDSIPEIDSDAVRNVVTRSNPEDWIFEGRKLPDASGWKDGSCPVDYVAEPFSETNLRAVGMGSRYADMVKLVATVAREAGRTATLDSMHRSVIESLKGKYAAGRGAYKGRFDNWSFHPDSRVRAQTPFVIIQPKGLGRTQLAPVQFVRTRGGNLRRVDTLYLDVDMIRAHGIDNNEKSFFAEFYLAMRATDRIGIKDVSFTNAFFDPRTNGPHISFEIVHPGGASDAYPEMMRIYRISGRFRFKPDFSAYPFDSQQFSIDIQPKNGDKPFVVQSPPLELRDSVVAVDGWDVVNQYVSYLHDFVPVVDAFTHEPSIVPFYKTRFVWQMKRETTDYYLRVVVPLAFILIVAYLSIFIPQNHLEAIVTIQITALLSAVALYLSLPQVDSDVATVSDRIFVLDYLLVSLMIVISILRINVRGPKLGWLNGFFSFVHIVAIPLVAIVAMGMMLRALPPGLVENVPTWETLRGLVSLAENALK